MVRFTDVTNIIYNKKQYSIIKVLYKDNIVPIILDTHIYDKIKKQDKNWIVSKNGIVHTIQENSIIFLHEIVYILENGQRNRNPIIHLNKIGLDNRLENLMEDIKNKKIKKNLNKKARTIKLEDIDVSTIPSFVWYLKEDDSHGERFQVELGNIRWKTTSCDKLSINYKLEEAKKYLRQYKNINPTEFLENSMNSDLNIHGLKCKKDFYNILKKVNMNYEYTINDNTTKILKEDVSQLNKVEKRLLKEFNIDSDISTYDRFVLFNKK